MKAKAELEFLVALIQEYTANMPQATRLAVTKHSQECVDVVYSVLEQAHLVDTTPAQPQLLTEETKAE